MKQNVYLNVIRGLSALLIVLYHYTVRYNEQEATQMFHVNWPFTVPWGCYAVITFFMLSGYLTSANIEKQTPINAFWKKRIKRLYPTFWVAMFLTLMVINATNFVDVNTKDIVLNLTMLPAIFGAKPIDGVYWTQQYELLFYVFVTFFLLVKNQDIIDRLLLVWVIFSFLFFFFQLQRDIVIVKCFRVFLIPQYCCAFVSGMILRKFKEGKYSILLLLILGTSLCSFYVWLGAYQTVFFLVSLTIMWIATILPPPSKCLQTLLLPILFISSISYPLYLVHQRIGYVIIYALVGKLGYTSEWLLLIPFFIVVIVAYILHECVEKRIK